MGRENLSQATTTCHPKNESWYNFTKVILELCCRYRLGHMHNLILLNTQEYTQRQKRKKIRRSILVFEPCLCRVKEKYVFYTIGHCTQQYVRYKKDEEILFQRPHFIKYIHFAYGRNHWTPVRKNTGTWKATIHCLVKYIKLSLH